MARIAAIPDFCDNTFPPDRIFVQADTDWMYGGINFQGTLRNPNDVYEPPSHELVRQLTELQLCNSRDLHRARGLVRRLSYDLPAFDSVWIDSLVQLRMLTPYQATKLQDGQADLLRIGPYVIVNVLGKSAQGATYLARRLGRHDYRVVKRLKVEPGTSADVIQRLNLFRQQADRFAHPHVVLHDEIVPSDPTELIAVTRFVAGLPLNELLVRRGRFAPAIVLEIGRQILDGLSALHAKSLIHGDIRMSNIRLSDNGLAVLVDGGLRQLIRPEVTIHDNLSLEAYDGIAPELIGTGDPKTVRAELYSVGCLLWQLLAGRPPYTSADPLVKLASHQTNTIDDVRVWAPDTPADLAVAILQMTSRSPENRPRNCNEVLQRWGKSTSIGRARIKQFRRKFDGDVPHFSRPGSGNRVGSGIWISMLAIASIAVAATLHDHGLKTELLEIVQRVKSIGHRLGPDIANTTDVPAPDTNSAQLAETDQRMLNLPAVRDGTILLDQPGPYHPSTLSYDGDLCIRGAPGVRPEIRIDAESLEVIASSLTLDGLVIRTTSDSMSDHLVSVRSSKLNVMNCEFRSPDSRPRSAQPTRFMASIAWSPRSNRDQQSSSLVFENTVFFGARVAMSVSQTPGLLQATNTLKLGPCALVSFSSKCRELNCKVEFNRLTMRESGPIFELAGEPANRAGTAPISIVATDCVFQLAESDAGLIAIMSDHPRSDPEKSVKLLAENSVVTMGTQLLTILDKVTRKHIEVDSDDEFDGLAAGQIQFAGDNLGRWNDSRIVQFDGPKESAQLPGVKPMRLGAPRRSDDAEHRDN